MISMETKDILALTASICTVLQFLSGTLVCRKYIQSGTTGDGSIWVFATCFMSCSLWCAYGSVIRDLFITSVNCFGTLLQLCYMIIFTIYSLKRNTIIKQVLVPFSFLAIVIFYSLFQTDKVLLTKQIGFLSCSMTVLFFASPLIQLAQVIRTKSTESLPFPVIMASMVVSCQWFVYGCLINDQFIQIPNVMGCVLSGFQLCLFLIYPNKRPDQTYFI